ncbi:hypothetical protein BKA70DRAFT_1409523 [Coprinopsis sp. MPI-PUGE-AT-0042]|nr:hypothetical protein BKA70DRAFT_1409523 [Coprinopsis sp. MPI-PUGE-AT-0042]
MDLDMKDLEARRAQGGHVAKALAKLRRSVRRHRGFTSRVCSIVLKKGSGLLNHRHSDEEAGQRQLDLALAHVYAQGEDRTENLVATPLVRCNVKAMWGQHSSCWAYLQSLAIKARQTPSLSQGHSPPYRRHSFLPLWSSHTPMTISTTSPSTIGMERGSADPLSQDHVPGVHLVVTDALDDNLLDGTVVRSEAATTARTTTCASQSISAM